MWRGGNGAATWLCDLVLEMKGKERDREGVVEKEGRERRFALLLLYL